MQDPVAPKSEHEAESILKVTDSAGKNELLFSTFGINYNNIDSIFRKGSTLYRSLQPVKSVSSRTGHEVERMKKEVQVTHEDIISDTFWNNHPGLLSDE